VSTIWTGIDMRYDHGRGVPVIFETMVFPPPGSEPGYVERYATMAGALAGHDRALAWLAERLGASATG
jgi:hypothetical protein